MNVLAADYQPSLYIPTPHLVPLVDGEPLDSVAERTGRSEHFRGLVTTLGDFLSDERERRVISERVLPPENRPSVLPILICPDDLDFWCGVVVVEVLAQANAVRWPRMGSLNQKAPREPEEIGAVVDWFSGFEGFEFTRENYESFLSDCARIAAIGRAAEHG